MAETSSSTSDSSLIEHLTSDIRSKSVTEDTDLISSLSDEVLTHILSYIDTKSCVATSVLSKRWNRLWISVPNLDFGDFNMFYPCPEKRDIFLNFVDRVLSLNNVLSVRTIRLHCGSVSQISKFDSWISSIAKRGAEEIDLYLYPCTYLMFYLPDSFFNRKNLIELKLSMLPITIPKSVCFPNLITIHLDNGHLLDNDSIKNLLSGCPLLRNLYLKIYEWGDALTLYICSSTLRSLHLHTGWWNDGTDPYNVVINAPNVTDLRLLDFFGARYSKVDVSSLVKLYLWFETKDEMSFVLLTNLPMFHNLTHLTLEITDMDHWASVTRLLLSAPNLLTFILLSTSYLACYWDDPSVVPHCFLSSLESVEISIRFVEHTQEVLMTMVSYILKNSSVLKKFSMHICDRPSEENEFVKTLLNLPRSSVACQVSYDEWMEQCDELFS